MQVLNLESVVKRLALTSLLVGSAFFNVQGVGAQPVEPSKITTYEDAIKPVTDAIQRTKANELVIAAINKKSSGDYQGALADVNQAINLRPDNAIAWSARGSIKINFKDYKGAIQDCDKAISLAPDDGGFYFNRGIAKYLLNDYKGGIDDLNRAISLQPDNGVNYDQRAIIKNDSQDFKGAIEDYNKAAEIYQSQGKADKSKEAQCSANIAGWLEIAKAESNKAKKETGKGLTQNRKDFYNEKINNCVPTP